jgi:hypothetical protein
VIVVYALAGWDPLVRLFYWGAAAGGIGAMLLITATSIAVIGYFARHRQDETIWRRITAPAISSALLVVISCLALTNIATLLGVEPSSRLTWIIPAGFAVVALAGAGWGLILRIRSPQVYAVVGLGLESVDRSGVGHSRPNDASHLQDSPSSP